MKNKKWITALCCGTVMLSSLSLGTGSHAAGETKSVKEYIVQIENDRMLNKVAQSFENEIVEDQQEGTLFRRKQYPADGFDSRIGIQP